MGGLISQYGDNITHQNPFVKYIGQTALFSLKNPILGPCAILKSMPKTIDYQQIEVLLGALVKSEFKVVLEELESQHKEIRNDILNFKDEIIGEISDLKQESQVVGNYRQLIANHESRISILEKTSQ